MIKLYEGEKCAQGVHRRGGNALLEKISAAIFLLAAASYKQAATRLFQATKERFDNSECLNYSGTVVPAFG